MICPQCRRTFGADAKVCGFDGTPLVTEEGAQVIPPGDAKLKPGDLVGSFRIEGQLGEGGMGVVYSAVHPIIGSRVAIKLLNRELAANPEVVGRFIQEATSVNQIRHPNIISISDFGQLPDGRHYFIMELLDGVSLGKYLEQTATLPIGEALSILHDVARALDAAHAKNIVHRDLKPDNIFLVNDDTGAPRFVKLLDFGIAKLATSEGAASMHTRTGVAMGTPYYMSPEQCRGRGVDHRADIYSLGVVAYQVLTGVLPFAGDSFAELLAMQLTQMPSPPSQAGSGLPEVFDEPLLKALQKEPDRRYQRATELTVALDAAARKGLGPELAATLGAAEGYRGPGRSQVYAAVGSRPPTPSGVFFASPGKTAPPLNGNSQRSIEADEEVRSSKRNMYIAGGVAAGAVVLLAVVVVGSRVGRPDVVANGPGPNGPVAAQPSSGLALRNGGAVGESGVSAAKGGAPEMGARPAPPVASTVKLSVRGVPHGGELRDTAGKLLGTIGGEVELPKVDGPVELDVTATGYVAHRVIVHPASDSEVVVELKKTPRASRPTHGDEGSATRKPASTKVHSGAPDADAIANPF